MIKLLKDCEIRIAEMHYCGDGCCSWQEWNNEHGKTGETFYDHSFDTSDLIEGVDYEFVKE